MKHIIFTVTNDLSFDQRMQRICNSIALNGFKVTLVGRHLKSSIPLTQTSFNQKRLHCIFNKGFLFYAEYNTRLFFYLLFHNMDGICAVDLDTIVPCLIISRLKNKKRIYDAHELFTEMKEVRTRNFVHKFWLLIEKFAVPKFTYSYTVGHYIAQEFKERYKSDFDVIRNVPLLKALNKENEIEKVLLYQGAVNEGRGFEQLIPAMKYINYKLIICGTGNFSHQLQCLIEKHGVRNKIELKGMVTPQELWKFSQKCYLGINLVEREGLNQYLSLANKFFDYIHAGIPQISMNYPEYQSINNQFNIAILIDDLNSRDLADCINNFMEDDQKWEQLRLNCLKAREVLNWQEEEKRLISIYRRIFQENRN